jgi:cell wall-associated NlpC family hydrolase
MTFNSNLINDYIGKPYLVNARGPDQFDCYGLVLDVYKKFLGITLPDWTVDDGSVQTAIRVINSAWQSSDAMDLVRKVDEPQDMDIAFLTRHSMAHHVGVYINGGVLHSSHKNRGTAWERPEAFHATGRGELQYWRLK